MKYYLPKCFYVQAPVGNYLYLHRRPELTSTEINLDYFTINFHGLWSKPPSSTPCGIITCTTVNIQCFIQIWLHKAHLFESLIHKWTQININVRRKFLQLNWSIILKIRIYQLIPSLVNIRMSPPSSHILLLHITSYTWITSSFFMQL